MAKGSKLTLLDLVQAISDETTSDTEVVATVAFLINSGRVQLCGNFAGAKIDLSSSDYSVGDALRAWSSARTFASRHLSKAA